MTGGHTRNFLPVSLSPFIGKQSGTVCSTRIPACPHPPPIPKKTPMVLNSCRTLRPGVGNGKKQQQHGESLPPPPRVTEKDGEVGLWAEGGQPLEPQFRSRSSPCAAGRFQVRAGHCSEARGGRWLRALPGQRARPARERARKAPLEGRAERRRWGGGWGVGGGVGGVLLLEQTPENVSPTSEGTFRSRCMRGAAIIMISCGVEMKMDGLA